jgi:hypothetical protein
MTRILLLAIAIGCLACGGERKETPEQEAPSTSGSAEPAKPVTPGLAGPPPTEPPAAGDAGERAAGVQPPPSGGSLGQEAIDPDRFELPPELGQDGAVHSGARFRDKNGSNVVVLVQQVESGGNLNNRRLWVHHYVENGGKRRVLRTVRDQEVNCEFDNLAGFVDGSLSIGDLDGDKLGEVTVAYDLGCMSDVSPKGRKVVVLENGEKWILRGESRVDVGGGQRVGGSFKPDPAQNRWPKALHDHAVGVWQRLIDR